MELKFCENCEKRTPHSEVGNSLVSGGNRIIKMKRYRCIFCGTEIDSKRIKMTS